MELRFVLTSLMLATFVHLDEATLSSCGDLDPLVDTVPGWYTVDDGSGPVSKYCAPHIPMMNYESCDGALGLESLLIPDDQLSASSMLNNDPDFGAAYARRDDRRSIATGWVAGVDDTNQWLKIDTGALTIITEVGIQGRGWRNPNMWVKTYKLEYSFDDVTYNTYQEGGIDVTVVGNSQQYAFVSQVLSETIYARYIKLIPLTWKNSISLRAEIYGCANSIANNSQLISDANLDGGWHYDSNGAIKYQLNVFSNPIILDEALGMESSSIEDDYITASSTQSGSSPANARLNDAGGWIANVADVSQYILINLRGLFYISMIQLQGANTASFTQTYYLNHSWDGLTYSAYTYNGAQKLLTGNSGDGNTGVIEYLQDPLFTRFVKINPQSWAGSYPSLRVELYGTMISSNSCSFWYDAGLTTPGFYYIAVGSNPTRYDGVYCGFSTSMTSCLDYKTAGSTEDGYYWIYPGGSGLGIPVYCYLNRIENDGAYTVISHDRTGDVLLDSSTLTPPYSSAGANSHAVTYMFDVDIADITTVIAAATFCHQSLYYKSSGSNIWSGGVQYVWWESSSDEQMTYWPGADPSGSSGCRCGQQSNCVDPSEKCNSDTTTSQYLYDGGFITDSSKLPVKTLKFGGFSNSDSAYYTLGDLVCMETSSTPPASCQAAQTAGYSTDGYYLLDPDGSGGPLDPVLAYCDFSSIKNAVVMEVGHNFQGSNEIVQYTSEGSFAKDIAYADGASYDSLASLISASTACAQYLEYQCYGASFQTGGNLYTWWVSGDGTTMTHWSGATTDYMCACGETGSCYDSSAACNCDGGTKIWREDKGYITDKSELPVSNIRSGGTNPSKTAFVTLGNLKCYERVGFLQQTCYDIKLGGATADGYYLLDPDGSSGASAFIAECGLNHNSTHAVTTFNHDSENRTHVAGYNGAGSFIQSIVYENMDVQQLQAQFQLSASDYYQTCIQYIKYECYDAKLLKSGTSWWVSYTGESKTYWGDADLQAGYCACGVSGTCFDGGEKCNCDAQDASWQEDDGYLIDYWDDVLPVVQLRIGDTNGGAGSEEGYFTLGKLECYISERSYVLWKPTREDFII